MNRLYNFLKSNPEKYVYLPLKLYWLLIFILTTVPGTALPKNFHLSDKIEHMLAYFGLAILLFFTLHFKNKASLFKISLLVLLIVSLYAAFDEIHQIIIPFRSAEILDFLADFIGAITGIVFSYLFLKSAFRDLK